MNITIVRKPGNKQNQKKSTLTTKNVHKWHKSIIHVTTAFNSVNIDWTWTSTVHAITALYNVGHINRKSSKASRTQVHGANAHTRIGPAHQDRGWSPWYCFWKWAQPPCNFLESVPVKEFLKSVSFTHK